MKTMPKNEAQARARGWTYLGRGRCRATFLAPSGKSVVKFPLHEGGVHSNRIEAYDQKAFGHGGKLARCRLVPGTDILVMEYVTPATFAEKKQMDNWIWWVDGGQVGRNCRGAIVAYDYGDPGIARMCT